MAVLSVNMPLRTIYMLEDDSDRLERFHRLLEPISTIAFLHFRTAKSFIENFENLDGLPTLICLDHDLFPENIGDPDPGDGRDVANYLATKSPCCPTIIHSSNSMAANTMLYTLLDAGWDAERISPIGEDWIESYWWPTVRPRIRDRTKR
jgi:hypothetical protein